MESLDFSSYEDTLLSSIINVCLNYYDYDMEMHTLEDEISTTINNNPSVKSSIIKFLITFLIDIFSKNTDIQILLKKLNDVNMPKPKIEVLLTKRQNLNSNIEKFKLSNINKTSNGRVNDFKYTFLVKFSDSVSDKVEFKIRLFFKYRDDNNQIVDKHIEMSISQFYSLMNDFNKIDTMINTLL